MPKRIILLDIDGTLIDYNYKSNSNALTSLIRTLQENDNIFVLNSNRALEDLLPIAQQFGIHGLLIGENGVFSYDQNSKAYNYFLNDNKLINLINNKLKIENELKLICKELFGSFFVWLDIDTVDSENYDFSNYKEGSIFILNNKYRKYTISAHVKKKSGSLIKDRDTLYKLVNLIKPSIPEDLALSYSENFANILVYSKEVNKKTAVMYLKENIYNEAEFIAIGDEIGDFEMINEIGKFFTTSNADNHVKDKAEYVSSKSYTQGVYEILTNSIK